MKDKNKISVDDIPFQKGDEKNFHVESVEEETLIEKVPGLDDEEEFACDMEDIGDFEDLPDSDRAMIKNSQKCTKL